MGISGVYTRGTVFQEFFVNRGVVPQALGSTFMGQAPGCLDFRLGVFSLSLVIQGLGLQVLRGDF